MAGRRKDALKRLRGLSSIVEQHLEKIALNPNHSSISHWEREVRTWLNQMEEAVSHVGKKTANAWQERIREYQNALDS